MPIQQLHVFLAIAMDEGVCGKDLERRLGFTNAAISRNISALQEKKDGVAAGSGLICWRPDKIDGRRRNLYLTDKGKLLLKQLDEVLDT